MALFSLSADFVRSIVRFSNSDSPTLVRPCFVRRFNSEFKRGGRLDKLCMIVNWLYGQVCEHLNNYISFEPGIYH